MDELVYLNVNELAPNPMRPRSSFPHESLMKLADSVRKYGVLKPILVAITPVGYQIICGERRWRAAKLAGLTEIPAIVKEVQAEEMLLLSLVDNLQVEPLTIFEQAGAIQRLQAEFGFSLEEIGQKLGLAKEELDMRLRLLTLSDKVKNEILSRNLSDREALDLLLQESERDIYQEVTRKTKHGF